MVKRNHLKLIDQPEQEISVVLGPHAYNRMLEYFSAHEVDFPYERVLEQLNQLFSGSSGYSSITGKTPTEAYNLYNSGFGNSRFLLLDSIQTSFDREAAFDNVKLTENEFFCKTHYSLISNKVDQDLKRSEPVNVTWTSYYNREADKEE